MDISGKWSFELDPQDVGTAGRWFARSLTHSLQLPGSLQSQGFGDPPGIHSPWVGDIRDEQWYDDPRWSKYAHATDFKIPFWLQPEKIYVGAAWYQRTIEIPQDWQGQRVTLTLERAHWGTRAWLDAEELLPARPGGNLSLSVPHIYELGRALTPGQHTLTLRVDNRLLVNVGVNAHSVSDHTQTDWNGVIGRMALDASAPVWIDDVQVYPDVAERSARVAVRLGNALGQPGKARLVLQASGPTQPAPLAVETTIDPRGAEIMMDYPLGADAQTWDEFHPALYQLTTRVEATVARQVSVDKQSVTFGLREVTVDGTQLSINGRRIFLRGTLECAIFPLTGYPPTSVDAWKAVLSAARSYGLNQLRFHSYCPPEAAFIAGDEMGFYYQVECASWANQGASIGEGDPLDGWLYEEGARITRAYGNHPSFLMMAYGNEPAGDIEAYLSDWVTYWKAHDSRRVYTSGAGWPVLEANQYHNIPAPRVQAWGAQLNSRINAEPPETLTDYTSFVEDLQKPIVSHEIGQWCVYPNFDEMVKYTGHIKPRNFEIFRESLAEHGMGDQAHDFLIASGKLQVLCYKEEIESALRTAGFAGFHLLDLHDFPGQGTALVGVLDPFWGDKGYITGPEYSRFCNAIVPLARMTKRYWLTSERFQAGVDIANFGPSPLSGVTPAWQIRGTRGEVASGTLPTQDIPRGNMGENGGNLHLGDIDLPLEHLAPAQKYTLMVTLPGIANPNGQPVENDWDFWVFPAALETAAPSTVLVTGSIDAALEQCQAGGQSLLLLDPQAVRTGSVLGFSSMFWNTEWTGEQAPHTLGILVEPTHPVFAAFPTESHSNWQWWELIHGAAAMQIDDLPAALRPLVQPIDTWFHNRRLATLFEAKVGSGSLVVSSMDLESDLDNRPVARQFRYSLLQYMAGPVFRPQVTVTPESIRALVY